MIKVTSGEVTGLEAGSAGISANITGIDEYVDQLMYRTAPQAALLT